LIKKYYIQIEQNILLEELNRLCRPETC